MIAKMIIIKMVAVLTIFCLGSMENLLLGQEYKKLASVVKNGNWIQPAQGKPAQPVWGHANGIQVGIAPMTGPRGLLRIYTPSKANS